MENKNLFKAVDSKQTKSLKGVGVIKDDELICNAIVSSFYQQKLINEEELSFIRNSISRNEGLSA